MSRDSGSTPERPLDDDPNRPLADDEEWDDEPDDDEGPGFRPTRRALVLGALGTLVAALVLVPVLVLTVPAVSETVLLPRASDALVLGLGDLPSGFRVDLDYPKAIDLNLDDSQPSLARKAQLVAAGFGGGWVRSFESDAPTGLAQVTTGVSVYRGIEGAHLEWAATIAGLAQSEWKRFSLGLDVGDESVAYEQKLASGHAVLVYYRYANILAQVSLTYRGAPDEAFAGAAAALRNLARAQTEKERLSRFKP